jgi:hypothetical protein
VPLLPVGRLPGAVGARRERCFLIPGRHGAPS